ncbi:MAG: hypothetical protein Q8P80_00450 [Candidatus Levybacteria bacterium]|nr:hypothetical protein [Candidatus Levybacteria bacterium]
MDENIDPQDDIQAGFFGKILTFIRTRKILVCALLVFFIFLLLTALFSSNKNINNKIPETPSESVKPSKIWEIIFSYNTQKNLLSVESVSIKNGSAQAVNTGFSPYKLFVLDRDEKVLFQTDVVISQGVVYSVSFNDDSSSSAFPTSPSAESIVDIPYFSNATKIRVTKDNQSVLEFDPPKSLSFNFPNEAYAAGQSLCTTDINVVFLSEGYASQSQFDNDVEKIKQFLATKKPYDEKPGIFDLSRSIYNPGPLGCLSGGNLFINCITQASSKGSIANTVSAKYPELSDIKTNTERVKFIVLVNGGPQPFGSGSIYGGMDNVGGQFGAFTTQVSNGLFDRIITHEFLGHAVGLLWDRYLYPAGTANSGLTDVYPKSNCTNNPGGENFWKSIAGTQVSQGCTSVSLYGANPLDCNNAGSSKTLMSALNCSNPAGFDDVEQFWIKNNVLPKYSACQNIPTSTPTFTPTPTLTPVPQNTTTPGVTQSLTPTPGAGGCVVINDTVTGSTYKYNASGNYTDWCRVGQWHCQTQPTTYRFNNWCAPETTCTTKPGDLPNVCVECNANQTLHNSNTYCRRFSGDCSTDPTKCTDLKTEWVEDNFATGCHTCQSGSAGSNSRASSSLGGKTPTPTPVLYNCQMSADCGTGKTLQMCKLDCTQK